MYQKFDFQRQHLPKLGFRTYQSASNGWINKMQQMNRINIGYCITRWWDVAIHWRWIEFAEMVAKRPVIYSLTLRVNVVSVVNVVNGGPRVGSGRYRSWTVVGWMKKCGQRCCPLPSVIIFHHFSVITFHSFAFEL